MYPALSLNIQTQAIYHWRLSFHHSPSYHLQLRVVAVDGGRDLASRLSSSLFPFEIDVGGIELRQAFVSFGLFSGGLRFSRT